REMVVTPSPLTERMTLFWHNHFTSSLQKVKWAPALLQQNQTLRKHATGSFRELLHAVLHDPSMLVYLDNVQNRKDSPNENLARELLELFTLGEGHYEEDDIKEVARALTGYRIHRPTMAFRFAKRQHDDGVKTILGHTGEYDADDVVDIILK